MALYFLCSERSSLAWRTARIEESHDSDDGISDFAGFRRSQSLSPSTDTLEDAGTHRSISEIARIAYRPIVPQRVFPGIPIRQASLPVASQRPFHVDIPLVLVNVSGATAFREPVSADGVLLPAALSHDIGSDSQRFVAIVIAGGLISDLRLSIILLPTFYVWIAREGDQLPEPEGSFEG